MIHIFPLGRSAKKMRPSEANASAVGLFSPDWMVSSVPDTAAAGRDETSMRDRRRKTPSEAATALGRGPQDSRPRPFLSVVFDAPRDTGCILLAGRCPRTTAPSEPPAGEIVESEGDDDREEFADEIEQTG